jgi:hypothetical protein
MDAPWDVSGRGSTRAIGVGASVLAGLGLLGGATVGCGGASRAAGPPVVAPTGTAVEVAPKGPTLATAPTGGRAALEATLGYRPEAKLFVVGTRLAFGAADASPPVLLRCAVTHVDDRDHWRLATVTCDAPAPSMRLVPKVAGTYAITAEGLWFFERPPTSDAELEIETMLLPAEPYPTYVREPAGARTWSQRTRKSGAGQLALWCADRLTTTSYQSWCFGHGTTLQAVTVADPSGEAMYTAR